MRTRTTRLLLDPTAGDGGSTEGGAAGGNDEGVLAKLTASLEALTKRHGSSDAVAMQLLRETHDLREKNRQLRDRVPADGSLVLSAEDAKHWQAYQTLGKPADLSSALSERGQYKAELDGLRRARLIDEAATIAGFKPTVLATLVKADGIELTIGTPDDRGVRTVTVKDGDKNVPLAEFALSRWKDHLPALRAAPQSPGTPGRDTPTPIPGHSGMAAGQARETVLGRQGYPRL